MTVQAAAIELTDERASPRGWEQPIRLALATVTYFVLGLLGRATIAEGEVMSLVWPAAGAAMLLFGLTSVRRWPLVAVLVGAATVVLNLLTGASGVQTGIFVVSNVAQAICGVLLLGALSPGLLGAGGVRPLVALRDFFSILAASLLSALLGAVIGVLGMGVLLDSWSGTDLVVWWGRNAVGCVVVVCTGVLVLGEWPRLRRTTLLTVRAGFRTRGPEVVLLVSSTAALYVFVLVWYPTLPVAFPLLVPTVWVGLRFSALSAAAHSLAVCAVVVVITVRGLGPFALVASWNAEVLISQLFIGLAFCLALLLALGRVERLALADSLTSTREASEDQAGVLAAIIDAMHDGLTVIDESGQVLRRNPAGARMVRTESDSLHNIRDSPFTIMGSDGRVVPPRSYPWARAIAGENVIDEDIVLVFDDGSPSRTLAVSARRLPTRDERGLAQAVVIYHDVTTDRAQRTALESFASVVAHDLRGPLGVVEGWTEMLEADLDAREVLARDQAAPKLEHIRGAAAGMRRLISDLLESSTSREQRLRTADVDLESVARAVADQRTAVAGSQKPQIGVGPLPRVHADPALVRQLLDNLVGNAVKYVEPGAVPHVSITGRTVGEQVEVTVSDEGIGIPATERDRIFDAFHRAHAGGEYDGHGIGLAVCKKIVERHGGQITARPPLGATGARIVFTLPAARIP